MPGDDPDFAGLVQNIVSASVQAASLSIVHTVCIDHWFGHKWFGFTGKLQGAIGIHNTETLIVPPFVPRRVISETRFSLSPGGFSYVPNPSLPLHILQSSSENQRRRIRVETNSGLFAWYSGKTTHHEHASLMVYTVRGDVEHGWYASFRRQSKWEIHKVLGLSVAELQSLVETGAAELLRPV